MLKSYENQFHKGSSTSLCGLLRVRLDHLGTSTVKGDVGNDDSVSDSWVLVGSVCEFSAGTRRRRNLRFLITTLPDLILIWYFLYWSTETTMPYVSQSLVLGFCKTTCEPC